MEKHIVIIEDDSYMLELMAFLLEAEGYRVTKLAHLHTLEQLIDLKADCFIIDEQLPYVNGHIICIMLKSKAATNDIPVILTSAFDELEGFATLCKANAYFKKPFLNPNELTDIVDLMIGRSLQKISA